jgi:hypothetical protein
MLTTIILRLVHSVGYPPIACITLLIVWGYTLTLLLGFKTTGPLVIMMSQIYTRDVFRFVLLYIVVLIGFTGAFYVLEESDSHSGNGIAVFFNRMRLLFFVLLNSFDESSFHDGIAEPYRPLSFLLIILYIVTLTIMLLNLLIAMMGDTFNSTKEDADKVWHMSYAQIITSLESEMSQSELQKEEIRYWLEDNGSKYLQVEEVDPDYYLPKKKKEISAAELMAEADTNKDGEISYKEIVDYMLKEKENETKQEAQTTYSTPVSRNLIGPGEHQGSSLGVTSVAQRRH